MGLLGHIRNSFYIIIVVFFVSCTGEKKQKNIIVKSETEMKKVDVPIFSADSAYFYIEKQVDFGPRVPNSIAHSKCHDYLVSSLIRFGAEVITQKDNVKRYDGVNLKMKNIIASFNPNIQKRILLCAHWDTRFLADNDTVDIDSPILGANDGGSGVGVLLEIARHISENPLNLGIDIILFDVEDQGAPSFVNQGGDPKSWCLGSQYWSSNPHINNYFADYGILLDMVGAKDAKFTREGVSEKFASRVLDKVWNEGLKSGFSRFFLSKKTPAIIDDHLFINNIIHIPTINIVEYNDTTHNRFNAHHHKHTDNMKIIDRKTLYAVGQTVLNVLYSE